MRAIAALLDIQFEILDGETIRQFIFFHEAGHAYDFVTNFADQNNPEAGVDTWLMNSEMQLNQLPLPGLSPAELRESLNFAGGFEAWKHQNSYAQWCESNHIQSEADLFRVQEAAYRALEKERFADDFAAKAIRRFRMLPSKRVG